MTIHEIERVRHRVRCRPSADGSPWRRRPDRWRGLHPGALCAWAALLAIPPAASAAERFSYLLSPTAHSVEVMVHTDDASAMPGNISVRYGPTTAYGATAAADPTAKPVSSMPVSYVYTVPLAGLAEETLYHYAVSTDAGATWGADRSFHTAPKPGTAFRFAAYSDFRGGKATFDKLTGLIKARDPLMVVEAGDLAPNPAYESFTSSFFTPTCVSLLQAVPLFHAPGNHEGWHGNTLAFFKPAGHGDYGSIDYGDVHLVIINDYVPCAIGSAQYKFIQADLAASSKPWKIAVFHEPAYTSTSNGHPNNATMQTVTTDLLEPNGVKLVICGHNHFYQRSLVNGIQHLVIGGGGAPLSYTPTMGANVVVSKQSHCYAIFDVTATSLAVHAYDDSNAQLDAFTLSSARGAQAAGPGADPPPGR